MQYHPKGDLNPPHRDKRGIVQKLDQLQNVLKVAEKATVVAQQYEPMIMGLTTLMTSKKK